MRCPSCGFPVDQQGLAQCPQCGRPLPASESEQQRVAGGAPSPDPSLSLPGVEPVVANDQTPPQNPYTPYTPPGQLGAYPPMPTVPPMAPAPRKNHTGLIVGIVVAVVVVLVACTGGTIFAVHSLGRSSASTNTPAASPTLSGSKVYSNTFSSSADDWAQDPQHCFLADDGYHAASGYYCTVPVAEQDNVDISVNVRQVSGPTNWSYGLFFRQQDIDNHYAFMITSNGEWVFVRCVAADCTTPVYFTANSAIKPGLDTTNTIEVRATGPHFVFFVNGKQVGSYDDTALTFGKVSLIATGKEIDCAFTDLVITRPD